MASVVVPMSSPHASEQKGSSPMIFKKKTRRGPKKQKKNKKPYFKLSWKEKDEVNEKERIKAEARLSTNKISAPNNTTQFLMQEHPTSTPNQTTVGGICYESDDDDDSKSSDDNYEDGLESSGVFMENDFAETFNSIMAETLDHKSKAQLISEIVSLEKTVNELAAERAREKESNAELMEELNKLRKENKELREENFLVKNENVNIPLTPVKDHFGFLGINDTSRDST